MRAAFAIDCKNDSKEGILDEEIDFAMSADTVATGDCLYMGHLGARPGGMTAMASGTAVDAAAAGQ